MLKVLNIHDEPALAETITRHLDASGYRVDVMRLGFGGITRALAGDHDVIIVGEALPDIGGTAVVAALRRANLVTPIIMISGTADIEQRVQGLRAGADDYLSMPFSNDEMLARIEVLLRKKTLLAQQSAVLRSKVLELDLVKHTVTHRQRKERLLPTECRLLEFMMRHTGRILTRSEIFEAVWSHHFDPGTNLIAVHVARLRRKLMALELPPMILTIRGSGYRFE